VLRQQAQLSQMDPRDAMPRRIVLQKWMISMINWSMRVRLVRPQCIYVFYWQYKHAVLLYENKVKR